jgi:hypothetical protein
MTSNNTQNRKSKIDQQERGVIASPREKQAVPVLLVVLLNLI